MEVRTLTANDPIDQLSRAVDQTDGIISGIRPDQANHPTPCGSWDVGVLVNHVVQDIQHFTASARGERWEQGDGDVIGDDWRTAYRDAGRGLLAAWRREDALERPVKLPMGEFQPEWLLGQQTADLVVHGWDLAKATGQSTELDPELGQQSLDWARQNLRPEFRGDSFGPEVPVPEDAALHDRLAGFFGRDPAWSPGGDAA
jgi:uncharacterized protein (TIGR03086 family)